MLKIHTIKETFIFENEDADIVYEAIMDAGQRGDAMTTPIRLKSGASIFFVIQNIIAVECC